MMNKFPKGSLAAVGVLSVLALFLVELPTWLLDLLLISNIAFALIILIRAFFITKPTELYSFPSIIVFTTLVRLALNVSSTKLVLRYGDNGLDSAGRVIETFGGYVGGDFVVGAIVFAIIAIVNFTVIAKGSARVAEVSARFALDSLPGRQLSIDSEMRAGDLSQAEAKKARDELQREYQFFGAMDGAMKWVQGDAVAGLIITMINALGGVSLGVSRGLGIGDSFNYFGTLTIGDGLVSIIPSLLISVAAGLVVTHASSEGEEGKDVFEQIFADGQAPFFSGLILVVFAAFGLFSGLALPVLPLLLVGLSLITFARWRTLPFASELVLAGQPQGGESLLIEQGAIAPLEVVCGQDFENEGVSLNSVLEHGELVKNNLFLTRGIPLPPLAFSVDPGMESSQYKILLREKTIKTGDMHIGSFFTPSSESLLRVFNSVIVQEEKSSSGANIGWWFRESVSELRKAGVQVFSLSQFLAVQAYGNAISEIDEFVGLGETVSLVENLKLRHPALVEQVFSESGVSYAEFAELLRRLIREGVSIRDLKIICESIAEYSALNSVDESRHEWIYNLHAEVRKSLSRTLIDGIVTADAGLNSFVLSPAVEEEFKSAPVDFSSSEIFLEPDFAGALEKAAVKMFSPVWERSDQSVVILCDDEIRPQVQGFFRTIVPESRAIVAIGFTELPKRVKPLSIGEIGLSE